MEKVYNNDISVFSESQNLRFQLLRQTFLLWDLDHVQYYTLYLNRMSPFDQERMYIEIERHIIHS